RAGCPAQGGRKTGEAEALDQFRPPHGYALRRLRQDLRPRAGPLRGARRPRRLHAALTVIFAPPITPGDSRRFAIFGEGLETAQPDLYRRAARALKAAEIDPIVLS